jgi:hypothetical protein
MSQPIILHNLFLQVAHIMIKDGDGQICKDVAKILLLGTNPHFGGLLMQVLDGQCVLLVVAAPGYSIAQVILYCLFLFCLMQPLFDMLRAIAGSKSSSTTLNASVHKVLTNHDQGLHIVSHNALSNMTNMSVCELQSDQEVSPMTNAHGACQTESRALRCGCRGDQPQRRHAFMYQSVPAPKGKLGKSGLSEC